MGWTLKRQRPSFVLCLAIGLIGLAIFSVTLHPLPSPSQDGATPGFLPSLPKPRAINDATNATPPSMGWNSWNAFACGGLDESLIRQTADAMANNGLLAAGYNTLTLDDCWSAVSRDSQGNLTADSAKFPSGMKAIGDYIHAHGLRYGIYASIGTSTCTGHTAGSLDHEAQDVATFAAWGVDYIKADRCNADGLVMKDIFARWRDAIVASGRPILLSASDNTPTDEPWAWGPITAHQWRMSGDISDDWATMIHILDLNAAHAAATAPGTSNDPDMLEVGNGGMTDTEYRTHLGLWALMSAPLIAGNDVRSVSPSILAILTNPEVIAVDQDALAFQAIKASDDGMGQQVWYKPLDMRGGRAVGLLNRDNAAATMSVDWSVIGLAPGNATVRDLWARAERGTFLDQYSASVPAHGLALLRIVGTDRTFTDGFVSDQPWTYMANELGPVERNMSNGGQGTGDGRTLTLNGVSYAKGLGGYAPSAVEFRPGVGCSNFTADIGVDDEVGNRGSVIFQVWGDGHKLHESGVLTGTSATENITVNITGVRSLRLALVAVDSTSYDSADWANARVACPPQPNQPPRASFTSSASWVRPGDSVTFDASASSDLDGVIRSYDWEFGDGSTGNGSVISHLYGQSGTFRVVLTVVDDKGASGSATADIAVSATHPPIAAFSATPKAAFPGVPIWFDGSNSTDPDGGSIVSYIWDFGDTTTSSGVVVTHSYISKRNFTVTLVVTDSFGATNRTESSVEIRNRPPIIVSTSPSANIVLSVSEARTFEVGVWDPDGDPLTFSWSIGGTKIASTIPSYRFVGQSIGTYLIRAVASDGSASVAFEWHVDVRAATVALLPPPELSGTAASIGVVALSLIGTIAVHALHARKQLREDLAARMKWLWRRP